MKERSGIDLFFGLLIGIGIGLAGDPDGWIFDVVVMTAFLLVAILIGFEFARAKDEYEERREQRRVRRKVEDSMEDLQALTGGFLKRVKATSLKKQHNTISGKPATDDVKDRAFKMFVEETGADKDAWDAMPEVARESWYVSIEEEDRSRESPVQEVCNFPDVNSETRPWRQNRCTFDKGHEGPHSFEDPIHRGAEQP